MKKFLMLFMLTFSSMVFAQDVPTLRLTLDQVVQQTLKNSPRYQMAELDFDAAQKHSSSVMAALFPRVSFDASYRYQSEVPAFSPIPGGKAIPFGDHKNYSYGPALNWMLWDSGGNYARWKSSQATAQAKFFDRDALDRQLTLEARMAYFQVQLSLEQVRALSESLLLVQQQYKDISIQQKVGTLSRIDSLSSHQEVLRRQRELRNARINLALSLRELFALTGLGADVDPSIPLGMNVSKKIPNDIEFPTVLIDLDPLAQTSALLSAAEKATFNATHPQLEALEQSAESARRMAEGLGSQHGPTVQLFAKTTRDYPNGPVLESVHQNTVGVTASLPIFEFKRVTNESSALKSQALSVEQKKEQVCQNLNRDWEKSHDHLKGLMAERDLNEIALKEAHSLASLVYDSYKAGRATYLEVENANYKALLADVQSTQTDVQILIQLATLDSLAAR